MQHNVFMQERTTSSAKLVVVALLALVFSTIGIVLAINGMTS